MHKNIPLLNFNLIFLPMLLNDCRKYVLHLTCYGSMLPDRHEVTNGTFSKQSSLGRLYTRLYLVPCILL